MNEKLKLGQINKLKIDRTSEHGLYLVTDDDQEDVLLPGPYVTDEMLLGEEIDVFIYTDSEDRIVATTKTPKALLGEFELFKVVDVTPFGVFVDWGLPKDLFVPKSAQKHPLELGKSYILRVAYDEKSDRLFGDSKIGRYLEKDLKKLQDVKSVKLLIIAKTPLGYKVIVENLYEGMIFDNEIFESIKIGDKKTGYIKNIRDDAKLDISLQPIGEDKQIGQNEKIISLLNKTPTLPYNYKSSSKDIADVFGMSKKSFKKALTTLKDEKIIQIDEKGIRLLT